MRRKHLLIVLLIMTMLLVTACGKSTRKRVKEEFKSPASFNESLEALKNYGDGQYSVTVSLQDLDNEGNAESWCITEKRYQENYEFSLESQSREEGKNSTKLHPAVVSIINNRLIVNFDSLLEEIIDAKDILGSYELKLPDYKKTENKENYALEIVKAFNKGIQGRDDANNILSIKSGKELKHAIEDAYSYLKDNEDAINEYVKNSLDGVDFDSYIESFVAENGEDIIGAAKLLGYEITKDQLEELVEKVQFARIEGTDVDVLDFVNGLVNAGNLLDESVYEEIFKALGLEINAKANMLEKEYEISYDIILNELGMKLSIACSYTEGSPVIASAKNLSSLTEITKAILKDEINTDGLIEDISDFLEDISGGLISLPEKPETPEEPAKEIYYSLRYGQDKIFRAYFDSSVVDDFKVSGDNIRFSTKDFPIITLSTMEGINVKQFAEGLELEAKEEGSHKYTYEEYTGSQYKGYSFSLGLDGTYLKTIALDIDGAILLVEFMSDSEITDVDDTLNKILIPYSEKESE